MQKLPFLLVLSLLLLFTSTFSSCKTGEGCGAEEKYGNYESNKKGKSNLFSKSQRKRMRH
jgi:predicted small secreted protein